MSRASKWSVWFVLGCAACGGGDNASGGMDPAGEGQGRGPGTASDAGESPSEDAAAPDDPAPPPEGDFMSTRGMCDINSGFPGDEACLLPPAAGEGIQIHVGPESYDEAATASWVIDMGMEDSRCYFFKTPNTEEIWFQSFEMSGRPGTHHIINSALVTAQPDGFGVCLDQGLGISPNVAGLLPGASKAYMPRATVAPENAHLGSSIPAQRPAQADMHYFNTTEGPLLREFWLNLYTVDREQVTEQGHGIRGMGGLSWLLFPIAPGAHMVYKYECLINADGRIVSLIGHTHKHGIRETAFIKRAAGGEPLKVFEQYDYLDPQIFEYNSVTKNPEFSTGSAGAYTGIIEVKTGDILQWECEVNNTSDAPLRYTNEVSTGEMCNLWGVSVGPMLNCRLP